MKNKIFLSIAIAAITAVAAVNVNLGLNSQNEELDALTMKNIEALAEEESGGSGKSGEEAYSVTRTNYYYDSKGNLVRKDQYTVTCCRAGNYSCTPSGC